MDARAEGREPPEKVEVPQHNGKRKASDVGGKTPSKKSKAERRSSTEEEEEEEDGDDDS